MKKILAALAVLLALSIASPQAAKADNDTAWFLGGVAGGLVLGDMLNPRPRAYYPAPVYVQPVYPAPVYVEPVYPAPVYVQPVYGQRCKRKWVRVWDPSVGWVSVRKRVCKTVQIQ